MKTTLRIAGCGLVLAIAGCAHAPSTAPLPPQVNVVRDNPSVSASLKPWLGSWSGKLFAKSFGNLDHTLVVERIEGNIAYVIFSRGAFVSNVGDVPPAGWFRAQGPVTAETLTFNLSDGTRARYQLSTGGALEVLYAVRPPGFTASGTLKRGGS